MNNLCRVYSKASGGTPASQTCPAVKKRVPPRNPPIETPEPKAFQDPTWHFLLSLHLFTVRTFFTITNDQVGILDPDSIPVLLIVDTVLKGIAGVQEISKIVINDSSFVILFPIY